MESDDDCVSLDDITLARSWGPKLDTGARTGTPAPSPPSERKVTARPAGCHSTPRSVLRASMCSLGWPGCESPERSPLRSAANTGTPSAESCSAMSWRVFVFPVPVAPAMRPWRLHMAVGIWTTAPGWVVPSSTPRPSTTALPSTA